MEKDKIETLFGDNSIFKWVFCGISKCPFKCRMMGHPQYIRMSGSSSFNPLYPVVGKRSVGIYLILWDSKSGFETDLFSISTDNLIDPRVVTGGEDFCYGGF